MFAVVMGLLGFLFERRRSSWRPEDYGFVLDGDGRWVRGEFVLSFVERRSMWKCLLCRGDRTSLVFYLRVPVDAVDYADGLFGNLMIDV